MSHLYAHPVLAPWLSDYRPPALFAIEIGESVLANLSADQISVPIRYELHSPILETMVSRGSAAFAVLVTSPRTMVRELYRHPESSDRLVEVVLTMSNYAYDIELTPYVITTGNVGLPITDEHDPEFHEAGRTEFALPSGAVLAIGDGARLSNSMDRVTSIIDIVTSSQVGPGHFLVDYEDTRIKVLVNPGDQHTLKTMRTGSAIARATLYPGLYLHAVAGAIERLSERRDTEWAAVLVSVLRKQGVGELASDQLDELREDAYIHAQSLLEAPLGHLLRAFDEEGDDS